MLAPNVPASPRSSQDGLIHPIAVTKDTHAEPMLASEILSHSMPTTDPDNPMNWPLHRRLYTSVCAWLFAAAVYVRTVSMEDEEEQC
jgi:hypothetical protein